MSLSPEQRHQIVTEMNRAKTDAYDFDNSLSMPERDVRYDLAETLEKQYKAGLPHHAISRCPFCEETLVIGADFDGLDGPFWPEFGIEIIGSTCPHALAYLGALNYQGIIPTEDECGPFNEIHSGPEVPFVVPRLLEQTGVRCIVSSIPIVEARFTVYFMTYFADPPLPTEQGHQNWLRQSHSYVDSNGRNIDRIRTDEWDFDVLGWMSRVPKSVGWIANGDETLTIRWSENDFPYNGLPGERLPLVLKHGKFRREPLPDGLKPEPYD